VKRIHLYISGIVQGVGYRFFAVDEAESLGLAGWVRNLPDGRVELVAEGPEEALGRLLAACRRGPRGGRVTDVQVVWEEALGSLRGFQITR
jgi:acylphosphatase